MKKVMLLLIVSVATLAKTTAQNEQGQSVIQIGTGSSLAPVLLQISAFSKWDEPIESFSIPTISATYDYGLTDRFSLGLAVSYIAFSLKNTAHEYIDSNNDISTEEVTEIFSRTNIGIRPLIHYGNSDRFDFYSGLRVGYSKWSFNTDAIDKDYNNSQESSISLQALSGLRGYFTDTFGGNIEVAIGSPYFLNVGLNYRFPY